ncbi:hypothetical protein P170DRAFT_12890 [Aspergillus steynii IBT 23096]|uniref:YT521-B-like splicing factor n=1 Tax=Aspergillus steynii IBT 23096 TaxID=1392250 RepID=A0A2I2GN39_9EURO|nr:uncharacterized protein P170DRAFT_12890 [Aspergillus steynii IBT 23096]PLB54295.1 hypothetical protein P170DRAFT_12890 [Aspergillus steynii IBT 23096]
MLVFRASSPTRIMTNSTDKVPAGQLNSNATERSSTLDNKSVSESAQQSVTSSLGEISSRPEVMHRHTKPTTYTTPDNHGTVPSILNMNDMRAMLPMPTYLYDHYHHMPQQFVPTAHPHGVLYPLHALQSYPGTHPNPNPAPYNYQFPQAYAHYGQAQPQSAPQTQNSGYHSLNTTSPTHFGIPVSNQIVGHGHHYQQHYQGPTQASSPARGRDPLHTPVHVGTHSSPVTQKPATTTQPPPGARLQALNMDYDVSKTIVDGSTPMKSASIHSSSTDSTSLRPTQTPSLIPRGPPRKPKQSGHALWVGNLPPGTNIVDLKNYFSRDATKDVESVFLISKSNCAFINYKTETACITALERFNDSRFNGTRLVCRLRRGPMTPASNLDPFGPSTLVHNGDSRMVTDNPGGLRSSTGSKGTTGSEPSSWVPNRYFVVKSLTVEDLEFSRRSGIWATQSHNEDCLNQAYESADNVYLVFSANKSGEYYGYARMASPIQEDDALMLAMPPRPDHVHPEPPTLDMTPTPATETAPTGRIINDAARGTIFWEADSSSDEEDVKSERSGGDVVEDTAEPGFQSIGSPFRIQWLSTERVPFHRTRGLRNPWNANREIKIARDGTEIEPSVGARLIQLFHPPAGRG